MDLLPTNLTKNITQFTGWFTVVPPASMINFVFSRPDDPRIQKLRQEWYKNGAPPMTSVKLD